MQRFVEIRQSSKKMSEILFKYVKKTSEVACYLNIPNNQLSWCKFHEILDLCMTCCIALLEIVYCQFDIVQLPENVLKMCP